MRNKAHLLGAVFGVTVMTGFLLWRETRPAPCTGGVTVELRPPLSAPGRYRFELRLDGIEQPCVFDVPWPVRGRVDTSTCGLVVELRTRVQGEQGSITGLTVGASPDALSFRVERSGEVLYDTPITPKYGPYETPRSESRLFCGERAIATADCRRGSSACAPYEPTCDGPEDCASSKACCASPEWGREYGPAAATQCSSARRCFDRFGLVACHADADCPKDMTCSDTSLAKEFKRPITVCQPAKGRQQSLAK
jgi:hypothetical protein